jgi:hypothetical protein
MARLFTVEVTKITAPIPGTDETATWHECDFAGIHFSRSHEDTLQHWVRIAAGNVYGPDTQVLFVHKDRTVQ